MRLRHQICLLGIVALTGCVRDIEIENEQAHITSVGPIGVDEYGSVVVSYTIRDLEGDDQSVRIDICDGDGEECGPAVKGFGGDPTTRLPTVPKDTDVLHTFNWNPGCGRYVDGDLVGSELDEEFIVSIDVVDTELGPVTSEPFTLESLGLEASGDCE